MLAGAAVADALRERHASPQGATTAQAAPGSPTEVALPPEVRRAGGLVWWSERGCLAGAVDVASGTVRRLSGDECELWPSPDGSATVTVAGRPGDLFADRRLELFDGQRVPLPSATRAPSGYLPAAWRGDGGALAVCFLAPGGPVVRVAARPGGWVTLEDRCHPAWLGDGRLALGRSDRAAVEVGGRVVLGARRLAELAGAAPATVRALAAAGSRLAVAVTAPGSAALAVVEADGRLVRRLPLAPGQRPAVVGLSPDGSVVWYRDAASGKTVGFVTATGRRLPAPGAGWLAWSPDGRLVAAATAEGVVLGDRLDGRRLALVPVPAQDVTWTLRSVGER